MAKWVQREPKVQPNEDDSIIDKLGKVFGIEDLKEFLNPSESSLHDPYLLDNIDKARNAVLKAVGENKKISIFADIDADGLCSAAIMYNYLKCFTENVSIFSNQRSEGHGIAVALKNNKIPQGTEFLLIVDSSTSEADACKTISEQGVEIVILDHHIPERDNPYALIVNPQCCDYPNKSLSGAGLCWKFAGVLDETLGFDSLSGFVDLAGIGLYADAMDMTVPENRYIVYQSLNHITNKGVLAMLDVAGKNVRYLKSSDIGFSLSPMINGAARLDKIELIIDLLTNEDIKECKKLAKEVKKLNEERKILQANSCEIVEPQINEDDKVIICITDQISKGFAGVVAGELASKYQRPVMVVKEHKGFCQGSYRSYNGFELKSFLSKFPKHIVDYTAGHEGAGGIGFYINKLDEFRNTINEKLAEYKFERTVNYDLEIDSDEIDEQFIKDVERFTYISGQGIPEVTFRVNGVFVVDAQIMGKKKNTAKVECDNGLFLMKFKTDENFVKDFPTFTTLDVVGSLNINRYYNWGTRSLQVSNQLFLSDYQ